jgi:hypothetical protein
MSLVLGFEAVDLQTEMLPCVTEVDPKRRSAGKNDRLLSFDTTRIA